MTGTETISATEFKAKCLKILDRLASHELEQVVMTKRGKPVGVLLPRPEQPKPDVRNIHGFMRGSVVIPDGFDLTEPVLDEPLDAELCIWRGDE